MAAIAVAVVIGVAYWGFSRMDPGARAGVPGIGWVGIEEFTTVDESADAFAAGLAQALRDELESRTGLPAVLASGASGWRSSAANLFAGSPEARILRPWNTFHSRATSGHAENSSRRSTPSLSRRSAVSWAQRGVRSSGRPA